MKPKWVATFYARKYGTLFQRAKYFGTGLLISSLFLIISCENNDDQFTNDNESIIDTDPANIIYTDIEPDFTSETSDAAYELDLNNDNIVDYYLKGESDNNWLIIISNPISQNGIFSVEPWYTNTVALDEGYKIFTVTSHPNGAHFATVSIFNIGECFGGGQGCSYDWKDKDDKYLGLRFIINEQIHYGWARLKVTSPAQWIIKDYAYNATPDSPILAGQVE